MKKIIYLFFIAFFTNCSKSNDLMTVNLSVEGFKKGNVYLQKIQDSVLINIDSIFIENSKPIILDYKINSPEIFYINLDIKSKEKRIEFFGEKGSISINTNLKKFNSNYKITGSKSDSIFRIYQNVIKKFNYQRLDLIKLSIEKSQKDQLDSLKIIEEQINRKKRQYLYTLNFAVSNGKSHVAPFIALNEFSEDSKILLDTIRKSLSNEVLNSKYGNMLLKKISSN